MDTYGQRLATLDADTGDRPSSRIGNAGNARSLVQRLKYEDETRMFRYTKVQGLLDGNPPWPGKKLIDLGQGHRANFNLREGEGIVDSAKTPYYDLVFEVPYFAQITFEVPGAEANVVNEWNDIISEEYFETLSAWSDFDQTIQLHQWQLIVHGIGPIFWPHSVSWQSEAVKSRKVLVPQETFASVDKLELAVVLHSFRADELESYISKSKSVDTEGYSSGWNAELVREAIVASANREMRDKFGMENYDLFQRAIRTGDLFYGIDRSDRIYVASIFIKEFGGKVSHYMITDSPMGVNAENNENIEEETGYLFKKKGKFNSFSEVICPFFYDTGPDGTWHSVKGLGPKIFDFCDISNRTFCQMLDGAVIGSGITLETQDANALEETQIALVGGATVVSPGYKVVQTRIAESLNGAMAMRRELQNTLQSNTGSYRQRVADENKEPTLGQAQMAQQQQALLSKGATNRYYNNLDKFHTETLRRLLDPAQSKSVPGGMEAIQFKQRCLIRGIPEQVLTYQNILKVRAVRSVGYGSPQLRQMANDELMKMLPMMDEKGRNFTLRTKATSLPGIGQSMVDSIFPKLNQQKRPSSESSKATDENNALRSIGGKAQVEPSQNHSIHFDTHMQDIEMHKQEPGTHPTELLLHMEQAGPHLHQHLNFLKGDPTRKGEVKQKEKALDGMAKQADQLGQQVKEWHQAQMKQQANGQQQGQQQQQQNMEGQAKMAKVHGELGLKAQKQQGDLALKVRKQAVEEKLKDARTAADIKRANLQASTQKPPQ